MEQYNAVRLLDFNIGRLMELAKAGGYYENTIFVLFGDHNTRISQIPHMAPAFEQLGLESNNVPLLIHAPACWAQGLSTKRSVSPTCCRPRRDGRYGLHQRYHGP